MASFFKTENIDMSDPRLQEAWKDLTNEKTQTNWCGCTGTPHTHEMHTRDASCTETITQRVANKSACSVVCLSLRVLNPLSDCVGVVLCRILVGLVAGSEKLEVVSTGTNGLAGLKSQLKSINSRVLFGALHISALDKRASIVSKRPKFVAFSYVGSSCTELQRANSSFTKNKVMQLFSSAHLTVDISGKDVEDFLQPKYLGQRLHLSTAAHKPTHVRDTHHTASSEHGTNENEQRNPYLRVFPSVCASALSTTSATLAIGPTRRSRTSRNRTMSSAIKPLSVMRARVDMSG